MSQYNTSDENVLNSGKENISYSYSNKDIDYGTMIEPLDKSVAKRILGDRYLEEGENYQLVTTLLDMSVICDVPAEGEKHFILEHEFHENPPEVPEAQYSTFETEETINIPSIVGKVITGLAIVITIGLTIILAMR